MKFPRIYHLPSSPGATSDDKRLRDDRHFYNELVVVTEKMDGENTCLTKNGLHARSEQSKDHPSRHLLKKFHSEISYKIPENLAIFGENLYAKHSIKYENLPNNGFLLFSIVDLNTYTFLDVQETEEWAKNLGIKMVPWIYEGTYKKNFKIPDKSFYGSEIEGYVVRLFRGFTVEESKKCIAKWVRANHVQTDQHWSTNWIPNGRKLLTTD